MKVGRGTWMLTVGVILVSVLPVQAGEFFERNGLAIDGYDPVAYITEQRPVMGVREFRIEYRGSTFQFSSAANRDTFVTDPAHYAPQYGGYCAYGMAKRYKAMINAPGV